ncbi:hypothetical protein SAMN06297251_10460 [Fulvimarina manganoxydans]|uniref:Phage DNA packaging protein, Nu1 subunit of terminase n=1 Tax=Fulvimarina manganoxydans TaxID=937218 RepID=A0A1W2AD76_9HYPH|nr:hypothetical protein [Fulvimarina manganoxydans]SMC58198.1 hypothetical protein SAMN06297251_10460 [Fulvimarina manganoxydans]
MTVRKTNEQAATRPRTKAKTDKAEQPSRVMSQRQAMHYLGVDRDTIGRWIKRGCPSKPGGAGKATLVDLAAVWSWREEQVRAEERDRFAPIDDGGGDAPEVDLDAEVKRQTLKTMKAKLGRDTAVLVHRQSSEQAFALALNSIRQTIIGIAARQERDVQGWPPEMVRKFKADTTSICREALRDAQAIIEREMTKIARTRLVELGVDVDEADDDEPKDADEEAFDEEA